jgi:hypothetical protein
VRLLKEPRKVLSDSFLESLISTSSVAASGNSGSRL